MGDEVATEPIRVYLDDGVGNVTQLAPVRGLDVDGLRVFHVFGPVDQPAVGHVRVNPDAFDVRINVRVYFDPYSQIHRFSPLCPVLLTNN